jgi:hypothetical protein
VDDVELHNHWGSQDDAADPRLYRSASVYMYYSKLSYRRSRLLLRFLLLLLIHFYYYFFSELLGYGYLHITSRCIIGRRAHRLAIAPRPSGSFWYIADNIVPFIYFTFDISVEVFVTSRQYRFLERFIIPYSTCLPYPSLRSGLSWWF